MKKMLDKTNEMAVYYGDEYGASFYKFTIRPEGNHMLPHIHLYVERGEVSVNIEIKLIKDVKTDELNILTPNTINKTSWSSKIAREIKGIFSSKNNVDGFHIMYNPDYKGDESFNFTKSRFPITTVDKILFEHKEQCTYWFEESKRLHIGMYYDLNKRFGNNTIIVYTDKFKEYFILQYVPNKVIPLYSNFSEDMDDFIMDKLIKDKKELDIMCKGFEHSLKLIEGMRKSLQKLREEEKEGGEN